MGKYIHWLKIGDMSKTLQVESIQWEALRNYMQKYPSAKAIVFRNACSGDIYAKFIRLECRQSYNDLDLDVNSGFRGSIIRLPRKPSKIIISTLQCDYYFSKISDYANCT